jgi:hypothetical protein
MPRSQRGRRYERIGDPKGGGYGFAIRDGIELHLGLVKPGVTGSANGLDVHRPVDTV